jgi:hypothetical protein
VGQVRRGEREAKRPRVEKRVNNEASQAELEAGLDDLVTKRVLKISSRTDAKR